MWGSGESVSSFAKEASPAYDDDDYFLIWVDKLDCLSSKGVCVWLLKESSDDDGGGGGDDFLIWLDT